MISLLKTSALTFQRATNGYYNQSGNWVDSDTTDPIVTEGSLQPYQRGTHSIVLPEGITEYDSLTYYTTVQLKSASQFTEEEADFTTIDGFKYIVFDVKNWSRFGLTTDNFECLLVRKDLDTALVEE